jgi:hypothetical protein
MTGQPSFVPRAEDVPFAAAARPAMVPDRPFGTI